MAKKSRNLVRLASLTSLLAFSLTLSGCHLDTSGARQNDGEIASATPYTIEAHVDGKITVDVAKEALPGEIVLVELSYDAEKVELSAVLANGDKIAKVDEDSFYFEMPAENVVLTVDAVIHGDFHLVNLNPVVELYGFDELGFDAGEEVTFSLALPPVSPYTITGVEVGILNAEKTDIVTPIDVVYENDAYSFLAPETLTGDIGVKAETETKMFSLSFETTNISKIYETKVGEEERTDITSKKHAYFGSTVTVVLKNTEALKATGIHIVETDETIAATQGEDETVCTFSMPAMNLTIEAVTEENRVPLVFTNTEHVTLVPSLKDEETGALVPIEDRKAVPGENVYLDYQATPDTFKPVDFKVKYTSVYGYENTSTVYTDDTTGKGYFPMPNATEVTIEFTEVEKQVFQLENSTNLQIKTYSKVGSEYVPIDGAFAGDMVYLKAEDTSGTGIEPFAWSVTYHDKDGKFATIEVDEPSSYGSEYYSFEMEVGTDYVISVIEDDPTRFEGESFVGDYVYANIYDNYPDRSLSSPYTIGTDGQGTNALITSVERFDDGTGILYFQDGKIAAYGDGFLFTGYSSSGIGTSLTNDDANVFAKKEEGVTIHCRVLFGNFADSPSLYDADVGFYQIYAVVDGQEEIRANFIIFYDEDNPVQYLSGVEYTLAGEEGATILTADSVSATVNGEGLGTITVLSEEYTPAE